MRRSILSCRAIFLVSFLVLFSGVLPVGAAETGVIFKEGFEAGPGDWHPDNRMWEAGYSTGGPGGCREGTGCVGTGFGAGAKPGSAESRLISPSISLPVVADGQEIHLKFWNWHSYPTNGPLYGRAQISTYDPRTSKWSDWVDINHEFRGDSAGWSQVDIDLTSYYGRKVKLGFYHHAGANDGAGWYIDDIKISCLPQKAATGISESDAKIGGITASLPAVTSFKINNGAASTASLTVRLNNTATGQPTVYMASTSLNFTGATWKTYSTAPSFTLTPGAGVKRVYFKVRSASGQSAVVSDTINMAPLPRVTSLKINNGAASTTSLTVKLNNTATGKPTIYKASTSPQFIGATWKTYSTAPSFTLKPGAGIKRIYFKVRGPSGQSAVVSDTIALVNPGPSPVGNWSMTGYESGCVTIPGYGTECMNEQISDILYILANHTFHTTAPMIPRGTWTQNGSTICLDARQSLIDFIRDYFAQHGLTASLTIGSYNFCGTFTSGTMSLTAHIQGVIHVRGIDASFTMDGNYSGTRASASAPAAFFLNGIQNPALESQLETLLNRVISGQR